MNRTEIGQILHQLRKSHGMTQKELARKLNVNVTTIKNWESGNCIPDSVNICAIADLFHVTTDYLFGRENDESISIACLSPHERKRLRRIVQAFIDTSR